MAPSSESSSLIRQLTARLEEAERSDLQLWGAIAMLLDICEHHGVTNEGHRRLIEKLRQRPPAGRQKIRLRVLDDKYQVTGPGIDCASLVHLCHARCCSFAVELSRQDLEEQSLRWDINEPYVLERGDDGYCSYVDRQTGGCTTYDNRPSTCRSYDCRRDARVWLDFENKVPAPLQGFGLLLPETSS